MAAPDTNPRTGLFDALVAVARQRAELVVLAVLVLGTLALPGRVPLGIYGLGLVAGAALSLQTIGIVLIYRANRIINFAQAAMGAVAGLLFLELVQRRTLITGIRFVCPSCVEVEEVRLDADTTFQFPVNVPGWLLQVDVGGEGRAVPHLDRRVVVPRAPIVHGGNASGDGAGRT